MPRLSWVGQQFQKKSSFLLSVESHTTTGESPLKTLQVQKTFSHAHNPRTGIESAVLLKELFSADGESGQAVRKVVGGDEKREEEKKSN